MGTIRESQDSNLELPSSISGFADWPIDGSILIDDIAEVVLIRSSEQGFGERYTFYELERLFHSGILGNAKGKLLREGLK